MCGSHGGALKRDRAEMDLRVTRFAHTPVDGTDWVRSKQNCDPSLCNCSMSGQSFWDFSAVSGSVAAPYCSHTARNCANLKDTGILEPPAARQRVVGTYHRLKRARRERGFDRQPAADRRCAALSCTSLRAAALLCSALLCSALLCCCIPTSPPPPFF